MRTPDAVEDNVRITDEAELMAAWDELTMEQPMLDGYVYSDGEIYCNRQSLERWRGSR